MAAERPIPTGPLSPDLTIVESRVYRGPNYWSYEKAIHLVVDLGVLEGYPSDTIPGFTDRLVELLPGLKRHACSRGHAGGFRRAAPRGHVDGPHRRAHRAAARDRGGPLPVARQDPRRQGQARALQRHLRLPRRDRSASPPAGSRSGSSTTSSQHEEGFDFHEALDDFIRLAERTAFGPSTAAIVEEAVSRDIPVDPAQQRVARPARPGRPPAAHPRHDDVQDRGPGRRHRRRQGPHREAARLGRAPGPAPGVGADGPRGDGRRRPDRLPGRGQAARRQPRTRGMPGPPVAGTRSRRPSTSRARSRSGAPSSSSRS